MFAPLSSHKQAVIDALRAFILRVRPYKAAPPLLLDVVGGLHDQCSKNVRLDAITLGAADTCDFILLDETVADYHARISVSYSLVGPLATIYADGASLHVNGILVDLGASSRPTQLPLELRLAEGIVVCFKKRPKQREQPNRLERILRRVTTTMAVLGTATISLMIWDALYTEKVFVAPDYAEHNEDNQVSSAYIDLLTFRNKLITMGLENAVTVEESSEGLFTVNGRLTPQQSEKWTEFSKWYDSVSFAKPMVVSLDSTQELPVMPPVSIVRLSEPKEIILKTGETMQIDSVFSGSWTLAAIEADHIVIARGSDSEKLMFARPKE